MQFKGTRQTFSDLMLIFYYIPLWVRADICRTRPFIDHTTAKFPIMVWTIGTQSGDKIRATLYRTSFWFPTLEAVLAEHNLCSLQIIKWPSSAWPLRFLDQCLLIMDINDSETDKLSKRATNDTIEATISNLSSSSPRQSAGSSLSIQPEWYQPSETRIDISLSSEPTPETIDACTFSPDGNHLATYSGAEGKITIWSVDELQRGQLQPSWVSTRNTTLKPRQYLKKTKSFAPLFTYEQNMSDVDFVLSKGGKWRVKREMYMTSTIQYCKDMLIEKLYFCSMYRSIRSSQRY